jgi:ribonucleotide reductase alpha subunit
VRATNSPIFGTNGASTGIVPMLKVFNSTARYCNQGGKRNGSFAIYIEPWHADIEDFLQMKRNQGDEEMKARDLFYALWIPDLFMRRVKEDGVWHLFCPNKAPGLADMHNEAFVALYEQYVAEGRFDRMVKARDLWLKVLDSQMETSMPYMLYKDAVNRKCNQSNLGTIRSSNLCTEITLYSDHNETAVCNLASVALNMFVRDAKGSYGDPDAAFSRFDFIGLQAAVRVMVRNLNQVIDRNYYPTRKTERSNVLHRPIGIGVQGLADCFIKMGLAFESPEAHDLNKCIFEVIYYAALSESCRLAECRAAAMRRIATAYTDRQFTFVSAESDCRSYTMHVGYEEGYWLTHLLEQTSPIRAEVERRKGGGAAVATEETGDLAGTYSSYLGSPMHHGKLQFDMWEGHEHSARSPLTRDDWAALRERIRRYGVRNSMLVAPMPTASTSQIFGNNECFEPYTSNIYTRRTMAGEFLVINQHMVRELIAMGLWSEEVKDNIIANRGSVQYLVNLPDDFKRRYKTVWEISMKCVINMARDRGAYICQSQSMNLWVEDPQYKDLNNIHFYAWQQGLKTGMYYMRRKPKHHAQQFTIEPQAEGAAERPHAERPEKAACPYRPRKGKGASADADDACEACGS